MSFPSQLLGSVQAPPVCTSSIHGRAIFTFKNLLLKMCKGSGNVSCVYGTCRYLLELLQVVYVWKYHMYVWKCSSWSHLQLVSLQIAFFHQNLHLLFYFDPVLVEPILLLLAYFQPGEYCKLPMTPWPSQLWQESSWNKYIRRSCSPVSLLHLRFRVDPLIS